MDLIVILTYSIYPIATRQWYMIGRRNSPSLILTTTIAILLFFLSLVQVVR